MARDERMPMFKKGDKVKLIGCPFDEQISKELQEYIRVKDKTQKVIAIKKVDYDGTTGQWIKTNFMKSDWTDKAWFQKAV